MRGLELEFAQNTARRAGEIALSYWQRGTKAEKKPDDSPVTVADRESERAIAAAVEEAFPEDGILGLEFLHFRMRPARSRGASTRA